jgi:hypothetical protein
MRFRERAEHTLTLLTGMVIGATIMYAFDEHRGSKRRAMARDKLVHAGHVLGHNIKKHGRDLLNRGVGQVAELRSGIRDRMSAVSDDQLVDRVRAQLGHVLSHSGLLEILAVDGDVTVRGPVLHREVDKIRDRLRKIRGVRQYRLELDSHDNLDHVAGVRGLGRPGSRIEAV